MLIKELGGKCAICGYDRCYKALDFHHINPETKRFQVMKATNLKDAVNEAKKTILLCSNCHREHHAGFVQLPSIYLN